MLTDQYYVEHEPVSIRSNRVYIPYTRVTHTMPDAWYNAASMARVHGGRALIRSEDGTLLGAVRRKH